MYYEYLSLQCTAVAEVCEGQNHITPLCPEQSLSILLYVGTQKIKLSKLAKFRRVLDVSRILVGFLLDNSRILVGY